MTEQTKPNDGNLVKVRRGDLAPVAAANALVSRGLSDLARIETNGAPVLAAQGGATSVEGVAISTPFEDDALLEEFLDGLSTEFPDTSPELHSGYDDLPDEMPGASPQAQREYQSRRRLLASIHRIMLRKQAKNPPPAVEPSDVSTTENT